MFKEIWQIAKREFRIILTDPRLRSVVFISPFLYAILMASIYSKHSVSEVPIALLNQDQGSLSRTLVRMLDASSKIEVAKQVLQVSEIEEGIRRGDYAAAIIIPENFTRDLKTGHDVRVTTFVNAAQMVLANTVSSSVNQVMQSMSAGIEINMLMKKGLKRSKAQELFMPIKLDLRAMYNPSYNYTNFMIPGILITILQQIILMAVALSMSGEREDSTLRDVYKISRNPMAILLGKGLIYVAINFLVAEVYLRLIFPLYDIPIEGSWYLTLAFTTLFIATIVTWGFWVSAFCKSRLFATQILMFMAMPSFVLSGFTWPMEAMPESIQWLSRLLPMTHFVSSFRQIYLAGSGFVDVAQSFVILALFLALNIGLSVIAQKRIIKISDVNEVSVV